ncbi:DMT family transporter [Sphingomonas xinjiangensis]|uniref:Drug/metabolite transporter (DMT)-like permease n=1 Tax=Sphingomonas xinjiangensis TaxID=643568 RepID=A0A840YJD1_9SPHN|nr:DMT family transporter [Sphingomonas xinjiangensis]MBB5708956.1 drug/metabolite transporter (DMT)-like permease [Sphingomonas xinjiangensis]
MTDTHPRAWRITGFALSAAGAMLFAIKGVLIKLIYRYGIDTTSLLAMRMVLAVPVFALVGVHQWLRLDRRARPDARTFCLAMLVGILGYYVSSWLDFEGLQTLDAQIERLILFTYPFLVILFGRLLLGHPLRAHALLGAGLSYVGLFVMFAAEPTRLGPAALIGGGLVATAAATFALYQLFARELIVRCGASLFTAIAMGSAGITALLGFFATHPATALVPPRGAWALIVALAVFSTVVPAFLMSAGTARIGAQSTAIVSTISPVVTIGVAIMVLGEPFGWPEALGTACVLGGVGLFSLVETRPRSYRAAEEGPA